MCGISGFIDYGLKSSENILNSMTDSLAHRGPDGSGFLFKESDLFQLGLGHRRLSIIDLSNAGKQPMQLEHFWITFNGEIYNYTEIKNELLALNHQFKNNTDTEVILHAFAEWGIKCVEKMIGMFAFVIYDTNLQELYCVRDRAGVKPFYYYWHDGLFLFASELKAFHKHPQFKKELNNNAIASFLQYGNVPTPHCIFNNCYKLKPGHFLQFNLSNKEFKTECYWNVTDYYNKPKLQLNYKDAITETETILQSAFKYRLVADVPIGVFLSGGYDSTCLTALLQKSTTEKLKTFTISVPDIGLNEAPFAKQIATHLGTNHHEYECSQKEALEFMTSLPYYYDEPFADSSAIPTMLVCKMAKQQVSVALSADAGDEVFAGYNRYDYVMRYGKKLNAMPTILKKGSVKIMEIISSNQIPILKHKYNFHNRYEKLKSILKDSSSTNIMQSMMSQFNNDELHLILKQTPQKLETAYFNTDLNPDFNTPLSTMMAIDYQTYLIDDILQKVDRASMSVSLEAREPFLDHHIIEWTAQLPDDYKYHNGIKKRILKDIVHQYIPKHMMDRPKTGFAIPIEKWLETDLKEYVSVYLNIEKIKQQSVFNPLYIETIKAQFYTGKKEYASKLWTILMFQMWYEKWMES